MQKKVKCCCYTEQTCTTDVCCTLKVACTTLITYFGERELVEVGGDAGSLLTPTSDRF